MLSSCMRPGHHVPSAPLRKISARRRSLVEAGSRTCPPKPGGRCPVFPSQMQAFLQFPSRNSPRINTSKILSKSRISLIMKDFNPTRISTSKNKHLKSRRINTSGDKDLKSRRINTSKKHGRGYPHPPAQQLFQCSELSQTRGPATKEELADRPVSRILCRVRPREGSHSAAIIPLGPHSHTGSSSLPEGHGNASLRTRRLRAGPALPSYLALHHAGFSVPSRSLETRWALTPPFHPYHARRPFFDSDRQKVLPPSHHRNAAPAVYFLWHCPSPFRANAQSALEYRGPAPWRYQARCP